VSEKSPASPSFLLRRIFHQNTMEIRYKFKDIPICSQSCRRGLARFWPVCACW
jgi:hypothetical protein